VRYAGLTSDGWMMIVWGNVMGWDGSAGISSVGLGDDWDDA